MAITFPSSPSTGQVFTVGNRSWAWDGSAWKGGVSSTGDASTLDNIDSAQFLRSDADDAITGQIIFPSTNANKPVFPQGLLARADQSDTTGFHDIWGISERYYPSNSTSGDAWGIRWSGSPNEIQFIGNGSEKFKVDLDTGAATATSFIGDGSNLTGLPAGYTDADVISHLNSKSLYFNGGKIGIGTASPFSKLQVSGHTFSGGNGMYQDSRVGISNHGSLTGMMLASTYDNGTYPEYGLVFVQGPSTSTYNVWSLSPDGPTKGDGLNFIYGSGATNIHTVTPKVTFDGNGNVGIGSTLPGSKLHVNGGFIRAENTGADAFFFEGVRTGAQTTVRIYDNSNNLYIDSHTNMTFRANQTGGGSGGNFEFSGGNVTIAGTGGWNTGNGMLNVGGGGDGRLQVRHIWGKSASGAGTDHLWVQYSNPNQHVQIGANGGGNNLYVAGSIYAGGYFAGNRVLTQADEGSGNGIDADTVDGIQGSSFLRSDTSDTATQINSPIFSGNISTTGDGQNNYPFRLTSDWNSYMVAVATNTWGLFWAGSSGARYGTNGLGGPGNIWNNVGNPNEFVFVGSDDTAWSVNGNNGNTWQSGTLTTVGDITSGGNITANSDISLKDNIVTIPDALDKLLQIRGVTYNRNDIEDNPRQTGVIAQEVEKVLPEVVSEDALGIKSVAYGNMVGLLIEAIKEQQARIDALEERLNANNT